MSKRISIEARVLEYFDSAPLEAARSLLSIVQHRFRSRPDFVAPAKKQPGWAKIAEAKRQARQRARTEAPRSVDDGGVA